LDPYIELLFLFGNFQQLYYDGNALSVKLKRGLSMDDMHNEFLIGAFVC